MIAKFIYEKFTADSDPISDMGIGILSRLKPFDILKCIKRIKAYIEDQPLVYFFIEPGYYSVINSVDWKNSNSVIFKLATFDKPPRHFDAHIFSYGGVEIVTMSPNKFFKHFEIVKDININEKFTEYSDPIADLGIGGIKSFLIKELQREGGTSSVDSSRCYYGNSRYTDEAFVVYKVLSIIVEIDNYTPAGMQAAFQQALDDPHSYRSKTRKTLRINKVIEALSKFFYIDVVDPNKTKKLKESLNEKFTEDTDPIADLGIGGLKSFLIKELDREGHITSIDSSKNYYGTSKYHDEAFVVFKILSRIAKNDDYTPAGLQSAFNSELSFQYHFDPEIKKTLHVDKIIEALAKFFYVNVVRP
jgi:hypothetical protein